MTKLQEDLLGIYNSLVTFNADTVTNPFPIPIKVRFDKESSFLIFEQKNNIVSLYQPIYYCLDLDKIKPTILMPQDFDVLMYNLQAAITSGVCLGDRTCLKPTEFGFDIYNTSQKELVKGPQMVATCKFITSNNWLFRFISKIKGLI
jgi:hypothetical protein